MALHPGGRLPEDRCIPCVSCAYDVRGQEISSRCPECGMAIVESALPDRLVFCSMPWLRKVVLGLMVLRYSVAIVLGTFVLFLAAVTVSSSHLSNTVFATVDRVIVWVGWVMFVIGVLGPVVGVWLATSFEPGRFRSPRDTRQMWMARTSVMASGPFLMLIGQAGASGPLPVRIVISVGLGAMLLVGMFSFGQVISRCLERIPEAKLARRMRNDSIQVGVLLGVAPAMLLLRAHLGFVAPVVMFILLISMVWYWGRVGACEKALRKVVKLSRGEL